MDQPKVKHLAEQISPTGTKYNRQTMEKHKATVMSSHLQTFEYNINPKESQKIYLHAPPYTTCHHRTLEYNRQLQGVPTNIYIHVPPYTTCHHRTLTPLSVILNSPLLNLTTSSGTRPAPLAIPARRISKGD